MAPRTHEQGRRRPDRTRAHGCHRRLEWEDTRLDWRQRWSWFEAAKHFARMKPARLVLTARDEAKGKQALACMYVH